MLFFFWLSLKIINCYNIKTFFLNYFNTLSARIAMEKDLNIKLGVKKFDGNRSDFKLWKIRVVAARKDF